MQDPTPESGGSARPDEERREEAVAVPASGSASWLQRVFEEARGDSQLSVAPAEPPPVTVVAVERYLAGAQPAGAGQYWYDVTLASGAYQQRCYLAPRLNGLVQRAHLHAGVRLRLTRCSYRYEEKRLNYGFPCLEELELACGAEPTPAALPRGRLPPLRGDKKHYLPLWNNEDPYGDVWVADKPQAKVNVDVSKLISLGQLEMTWRSRVHYHPLLVRVLHKSRLRYYGKPEKKMDMPYQAYFEVADGSGMMSMVLWNSLCPEWYNSMKVGTVLLLEQYAVKTSYPFKTKPTPGDSQMKRFATIEISLNVRDPPTKITIIPEEMVKPEWGLPEVKYRFITRSELDGLPHNHSCDVIGLVTFVGRAERTRKKEHGEDFWLYRWAHAIDGTSDQPFILELFATSQPEVFEHIHPMTYLVCTQMRVVRDLTENLSSTVYLTTSNESQIFITGWHRGQPYTKDTKVRNFIQWTKTQNEVDQMEKAVIGGYYPFPRPPNNFLKYCKNNKVESVLKAIGETVKEIEDLHYREHKRIAVQGIISAIRYISCSNVAEEALGVELAQKDNSQSLESSAVSKEDSVHKEKGTNLQNKEAKSFLESQYTPGEKHHHQALLSQKSSVKRKMPRRLNTDAQQRSASVTPVSSHHYFTRSARRKLGLDEFQHEDTVQDKNRQTLSDSSQHSTDQEGMSDILETEEAGRACGLWQSDLWAQVKDKLMKYLHHSTIFPESIPRKFDYVHRDLLMQQYNLHAAVHQPKETRTHKNISDFKSASGLGYYEVTVLGINHDVAIDVAFLPLFCPDDPHLFQLEDIQNDTLLSCMSCISESQQTASSNGRLPGMFPLSDEIVKAAMDLDGKHVVCILDICHLGGDKVEVFLSKIYKTVEPNVMDAV
ncbi:RPA-related protein RADX [Pezoporus wallicus]|uniref:RPA-related protein RADX n=1 Tax=Pezoporus wallicus TaxID=35540 RepID=UPI00254D9AC1|nr:RPA-related protein RADX [Pezoporus wallicus]XP_061302015.1 RPA-related protein RADX [Pezoporus flaviventris]